MVFGHHQHETSVAVTVIIFELRQTLEPLAAVIPAPHRLSLPAACGLCQKYS